MRFKVVINRLLILIILAFAGFVFWLGLEHMGINENNFGIVHTNTSGWSTDIIQAGKYSWSFEKVIPNNYKLHIFTIESVSINYKIESILPSGVLYATFNSIESNNFKYDYELTGSIKLNSSYLPDLVSNGDFTEETYNEWLQVQKENIQSILKSYVDSKIQSMETFTINGATREYIAEMFPYFYFGEIVINLNSPDMTLYNNCRNRYLQNLDAQTSADEQYLVERLRQENEEQLKLDLLRQYGEVFTEFPIMIEYLKVDNNMALKRATMDDFISTQSQK